jgi:hypothetical protein
MVKWEMGCFASDVMIGIAPKPRGVNEHGGVRLRSNLCHAVLRWNVENERTDCLFNTAQDPDALRWRHYDGTPSRLACWRACRPLPLITLITGLATEELRSFTPRVVQGLSQRRGLG